MKRPDDWPKLRLLAWLRPWRRRGLLLLAERWRKQDNIEWFCT